MRIWRIGRLVRGVELQHRGVSAADCAPAPAEVGWRQEPGLCCQLHCHGKARGNLSRTISACSCQWCNMLARQPVELASRCLLPSLLLHCWQLGRLTRWCPAFTAGELQAGLPRDSSACGHGCAPSAAGCARGGNHLCGHGWWDNFPRTCRTLVPSPVLQGFPDLSCRASHDRKGLQAPKLQRHISGRFQAPV